MLALLAGVASVAVATDARAFSLLADFERFIERSYGMVFINGGITFSELEGASNFFAVDATDDPLFEPFFPRPNKYLTAGGIVPGPSGARTRLESFRIDFEGTASYASLEVLAAATSNTLSLIAMKDGDFVASGSVTFSPTAPVPGSFRILEVSAPAFDSLRVVAAGPDNNGGILAAIDNVRVVPEAGTGALAAFTGLLGALRRRARSRSTPPAGPAHRAHER